MRESIRVSVLMALTVAVCGCAANIGPAKQPYVVGDAGPQEQRAIEAQTAEPEPYFYNFFPKLY